MANTILTHSMIADRALWDLMNELTFAKNVYKGYTSEFHAVGRYKKGSSVTIQLPQKFRTKSGATMDLDLVDTLENSTTVTVDQQNHVAFAFTGQELTLDIEDFSRKYIRPATIALANKIDYDGLGEYVNVYNQVGTPGTTPSTFGVLADAAQRLDNEAIPREDRCAVLSPKSHWSMADGELKSVFQQQMVDTLIRKGFIGNYALMDFYMDQNVRSHTVGTHGTDSPLVNDGSATEGDTTITADAFTASTVVLKEGDIITVAGVNAVNPVNGQAWEGSQLRQFVVTSDVTSNGSGAATIPIYPTLYSSLATEAYLPYQTVDALPANNAAITVVGTSATAYPINMIFHPNAFALTMVPFEKPMSAGESVQWGAASDDQLGAAITVATAWDQTNYKESTRLDVLYGWDTIEPNYAVRLIG